MSDDPAAPTTDPAPEPAPPFDPDPDLVASVENNRFAVASFRKAAREAHEAAERRRAGQP